MIGIYVMIGIFVLLILWAIIAYNSFVKRKLMVDNNYSQIKIQCKKRFDLIPNLVETVKGAAMHERETLESVIAARNMGASASTPEALANASNQLSQTLGKLFSLTEAYPDLKSNANFSSLQRELTNLEKSIAVARQFYNDTVMMYNKKIMVFPNNVFAGLFRFTKAEFFDVPVAETKNVVVKF